MTSTRTINRERKVIHLKESLSGVIDLLLLQNQQRDAINMAEFKALDRLVKEMLQTASKPKLNVVKIYHPE